MIRKSGPVRNENRTLQAKYDLTALFYDFFDYYWERQYRQWRPMLTRDVRGTALEAGVGTGRNLEYYSSDVNLIGIDICFEMLRRAAKRAKSARCTIDLRQEDATVMESIPTRHCDWLVSTFLCCVMPNDLQPLAIKQFERILKPGGRFGLVDLFYYNKHKIRTRQDFFAPIVEKLYGARFDRDTMGHLSSSSKLKILNRFFLKEDVYVVIEGIKDNES
jgi:ubiquinone/menaquinone biosynthesis C-methylase UbiE